MNESLWIFPFGKHKGKPIEDVPSSYLNWLLEQDDFCKNFANKLDIINKELKFRKDNETEPEPDIDKNWNRRK